VFFPRFLDGTSVAEAVSADTPGDYDEDDPFQKARDLLHLRRDRASSSPQRQTESPAQQLTQVEVRTFNDPKSHSGVHHVFGFPGDDKIFFRGKLEVDADGSPNTYHVGMTCTDGENDWDHEIVHCAKVCEGAKCTKHEATQVRELARLQQSRAALGESRQRRAVQDGRRQVRRRRLERGHVQHDRAREQRPYDNLGNGGRPGDLYGMAKRSNGKLCILNNDANGGHYVSTTAWNRHRAGAMPAHATWDPCDPLNYVNSETINYVALPSGSSHLGVHQGDIIAVANWDTEPNRVRDFRRRRRQRWRPRRRIDRAREGALASVEPEGGGHAGERDPHKDRVTYLVFPKSYQPRHVALSQSQSMQRERS